METNLEPSLTQSERKEPPISCSIEVSLPMRLNPSWVVHACRTARVAKPRWRREAGMWTSASSDEGGIIETIRIRKGKDPKSVVIETMFVDPSDSGGETDTARRLVTALVTGMQWLLRQRQP